MRELRNHPAPQLTILFDVNLPHLDRCNSDCQYNKDYNCIHRFNFPVRLIYLHNEETSFSDFKILWSFFEWIKDRKVLGSFVLVTKDRDFLKDAKAAYRPPRRKHWDRFRIFFDTNKDRAIAFGIPIVLKKVKSNDRQLMIRQILDLEPA